MRKIITLSFLLITTCIQTIKGTIIDKDAEYPLIGVNVLLIHEELNIGTTTDLEGNFKLENIPVGRQTIQLSYIGYKTLTLPNILVRSGKEIALTIQMEEEINRF